MKHGPSVFLLLPGGSDFVFVSLHRVPVRTLKGAPWDEENELGLGDGEDDSPRPAEKSRPNQLNSGRGLGPVCSSRKESGATGGQYQSRDHAFADRLYGH